ILFPYTTLFRSPRHSASRTAPAHSPGHLLYEGQSHHVRAGFLPLRPAQFGDSPLPLSLQIVKRVRGRAFLSALDVPGSPNFRFLRGLRMPVILKGDNEECNEHAAELSAGAIRKMHALTL